MLGSAEGVNSAAAAELFDRVMAATEDSTLVIDERFDVTDCRTGETEETRSDEL